MTCVAVTPEARNRMTLFKAVTVRRRDVGQVRLDNVVNFVPGAGPVQIDRQERQVRSRWTGNLKNKGMATPNRILARSEKTGLPPGYTTGVTGMERCLPNDRQFKWRSSSRSDRHVYGVSGVV